VHTGIHQEYLQNRMRNRIKTGRHNVSMAIDFPCLGFSERCHFTTRRYSTELTLASECFGRDAILDRATAIIWVIHKLAFTANDVIDDGFNHY
jgi:hypothetical protein